MDNNGMNFQPNMDFNQQFNKPSKAFGIASLVCGILSLLCCCCSEYVGLGLGIAAIVLFVLERTIGQAKTGLGVAGLTCGIVAVVISGLTLLLSGIIAEALLNALPSELQSEMSSILASAEQL